MDNRGRDRHSVLIPSGNYTCMRSLGERGIHTILASEHDGTPAASSRFCDELVRIPGPPDGLVAYKDALLGIAARPDVKTIVPTRPEDGYVFSKYKDEFEQYVTLVVPEFDTIRRVHDRILLYEAAQEAGVPMPRTRLFSDVEVLDKPAIVKPRYNVIAREYVAEYDPNDYDIIKSVRHLRPGDTPDPDEIYAEMNHDPIVQDYVPGDGKYMFAALYDHGEAVETFQHLQIRGNSYTGGGGVYRKSVYIPELESVARALLDHLDWHGLACIEYLKDAETGEFKPIEINPRMWQSLPSTVYAGADFPYDYWLLATGQKRQIEPGYELGVGTHYLWGELGYITSVRTDESPLVERPSLPKTVWEVLSSIYDEPRFDLAHLDDPIPFAKYVWHALFGRKERNEGGPGADGETAAEDPATGITLTPGLSLRGR
ncbi:ATP-grasp protein-like protein [Haloferax mucosum ATCC BAA-1512]|uniref:ATP-grasp protein-like protein n=1 Tax=Haloferax mucosum ATCC BAA-1512 TaxID=662479 RepID=M0IMM0_9EURY|nr:ATP-grasp protein [Haloferax mucosum]ELZ98031.1 ATP-grasp protein-like protein [Haloferax mucosum ATCC BAA-1512]